MKNQLLKIATKLTGKPEEEISSLLFDGDNIKEDAADVIIAEAESKVAKLRTSLKEVETTSFDKGFQKAEAKYKTLAEREFAEKTGIEFNDGETIDDLIERYKELNKPRKVTMPDDEVKKHPLYRALEKERVPKTEFDRVNGEFEQYKQQAARREMLSRVKPSVWSIVTGMNPILPKDPKVAETHRNVFLNEFDQFDYQVEGEDILVIKDGKRIEDSLGNPLKFADFVKDKATTYFEFMKQPPVGGAGQQGQAHGGAVSLAMPKTVEEFNSVRSKLSGKELVEYDTAGRLHLRQLGEKI